MSDIPVVQINSIAKFVNKKVQVKKISHTTKDINHEIVKYKNNNYVVCCCPFNNEYKLFIIDEIDKEKVIHRAWHFRNDGNYMASAIDVNDVRKELYLHNLIMDKLTFNGKGQQHTIDHISRYGLDNRKLNLREVDTQSAQNFNQKRRERTCVLPENCGIDTKNIPKNVYYGKPNGGHGDFFYIEIRGTKSLGEKFVWKTSKSKNMLLSAKFNDVIEKLNELKKSCPELNDIINNVDADKNREQLLNEFNNIIMLSHYPKNIIEINKVIFTPDNVPLITENNKNINEDINKDINKDIKKNINENINKDIGEDINKDINKDVDNYDIKQNKLPKYVYYCSEKYGPNKTFREFFRIEGHPQLNGKIWSSTKSNKILIQNKLNETLQRLNEINNGEIIDKHKQEQIYPIGIRIDETKDVFILDYRDKIRNKRYNSKMKINHNISIDENYNSFKQKIIKKYGAEYDI